MVKFKYGSDSSDNSGKVRIFYYRRIIKAYLIKCRWIKIYLIASSFESALCFARSSLWKSVV